MSSLSSFFAPRSVAVLGASRQPDKLGAVMARQLSSFSGPVGLVNARNPDPAQGVFGSVRQLTTAQGLPPELVVACLPAAVTPDALAEAAEAGSRAAIICSGGYAEVGGAGRRLQEKLGELVAATGMRILGPNTSGLIVPRRGLIASFVGGADLIPAGPVAVVATSGGMGHTVAFACARDGIGVATAVGLGNCADVTAADVIEHLATDPEIRCVALHLESVQDGSRLLAAVRSASVTTPIVALVVGRSDVEDFARSHTGALATSWRTTRSLLKQAGAVLVDDERELVDAAAGLSMVRLPAGSEGRTGLVTAQAGPGLLLTDALRTLGTPMPLLQQETVDRLGTLLPPLTYQLNPVDTGRPGATYQEVMLAVGEDPGVDLMTVFGLLEPDAIDLGAQVREAAVAIRKPMVAVIAGLADEVREVRRGVREAGVVGVDTPAAAVTVIDALRRDSRGQARLLRGGAGEAPAVLVLAERPDEDNLKRSLAEAGVATPRGLACDSEAEVRKAFDELGGPVVLKMLEPVLAHKTEAGAVHLNLRTGADVDRALAALRAIGAVRYLVEEMAPGGVELIVGARRDPVFGPVVMVGVGGTNSELIADVAIRAWPVQAETVGEMVDELALGQVLRGYRGGPSIDEASLHHLLTVLGGVVAADPSISSFEVNPAQVRADGTLIALDASVIAEEAVQSMTKHSLMPDSGRVI